MSSPLVMPGSPPMPKRMKSLRAIPILYNIEPFVNFPAEFAEPEIAAEEDGPARFAQFQEGGVGRMLDIVPRQATQNRVSVRRTQSQGGAIFDHGVILGRDEAPVDGASEDRLEGGIGLGVAGF